MKLPITKLPMNTKRRWLMTVQRAPRGWQAGRADFVNGKTYVYESLETSLLVALWRSFVLCSKANRILKRYAHQA